MQAIDPHGGKRINQKDSELMNADKRKGLICLKLICQTLQEFAEVGFEFLVEYRSFAGRVPGCTLGGVVTFFWVAKDPSAKGRRHQCPCPLRPASRHG